MQSALTPNTAAFLEYISPGHAPTSAPPAALFNNILVPGRDTPEDTPPSASNGSQPSAHQAPSDGSASPPPEMPPAQPDDAANTDPLAGNGANKRKAGRPSAVLDDDDDDASDSDLPSGHEDKKQHGAARAAAASASGSGRRGGRKSGGGEGDGKRELSKSERRKEQNRAAQKAFRERREAKVKDLEDKVAELENKAYGTQIENENLRGILKRLQEENVALKQSAFTFSMPVNSRNSPNSNNGGFPAPAPQNRKPLTPPQSSNDDSLKTVDDISMLPHRHSSANTISDNSSESLVSLRSTDRTPPALFSDHFNTYALGVVPVPPPSSSSQPTQKYPSASNGQQSISSNSNSSNVISPPSADQSEFNALWESLYPNDVENLVSQNANQNQGGPFTLLNSQPDSMSFASAGNNNSMNALFNFGAPSSPSISNSAQPSVNPAPASVTQTANHITQNLGATGQASDWNRFAFREPTAEASAPNWDLTDNSVNEFLASLSGDTTADATANDYLNNDDEAFNAQLRKIFGNDNSPSAAFNLPSTSFSPNNYLNMSPSPMMPLSNSQSPQSSDSRSNTNVSSGRGNDISMADSPEYSMGSSRTSVSHDSTDLQGKTTTTTAIRSAKNYSCKSDNEVIHVVDEKGRVIKPSELWMRFGMQHENSTEHLLIDDLCDQMRAKATCKDGKMQLDITDAAVLFRRGERRPSQ
ncbi:hypothetical protein AYX14_00975 [Cryptococcus neoformans]|nr:hypothetical protein AYX14_00975 [Cryptococcus neoformans var. grubii]